MCGFVEDRWTLVSPVAMVTRTSRSEALCEVDDREDDRNGDEDSAVEHFGVPFASPFCDVSTDPMSAELLARCNDDEHSDRQLPSATTEASGEDADASGTDEQSNDDQDDAVQHLLAHQRNDARDDEDDGENPEK
jgi:hypothetical protein